MVHLDALRIPFPKGYGDSVRGEVAEAAMTSSGVGESPSVAVVLAVKGCEELLKVLAKGAVGREPKRLEDGVGDADRALDLVLPASDLHALGVVGGGVGCSDGVADVGGGEGGADGDVGVDVVAPKVAEEDVATTLARGWVTRFTKGSRATSHAAHAGRGVPDTVVAVDRLAAVEGVSKQLSLAQATKVTRAGSPVGGGRCRRVEAEARLDGCDHGVVGGAEEGVGCVRREDVARTGLHELEEVGALAIGSASPKELVPGDLGVEVAHGGPDGGW